ncbi:MAG: hypothetical protein Q8L69_12665, partial [Gallionellaceae bacterium]|nr:hypothetical protein [Gallionellaceae bacterium]
AGLKIQNQHHSVHGELVEPQVAVRTDCRGPPGGKLLSFASPKESNQRKGDPGAPPLRGTLRCSTGQAAAELALRAQTVLAEIP